MTRVGVDSGLVRDHEEDMRRTGEEEEVSSDERRRVEEENTINELKSKTGKG